VKRNPGEAAPLIPDLAVRLRAVLKPFKSGNLLAGVGTCIKLSINQDGNVL